MSESVTDRRPMFVACRRCQRVVGATRTSCYACGWDTEPVVWESDLATAKAEKDEAERRRAEAVRLGEQGLMSGWKGRAESAEASLRTARERIEAYESALHEIVDWDAGWNLDYRQHFLNLQGIARSALAVAPKEEG